MTTGTGGLSLKDFISRKPEVRCPQRQCGRLLFKQDLRQAGPATIEIRCPRCRKTLRVRLHEEPQKTHITILD
jgi:phage FluMu protein Com